MCSFAASWTSTVDRGWKLSVGRIEVERGSWMEVERGSWKFRTSGFPDAQKLRFFRASGNTDARKLLEFSVAKTEESRW